MHQHPPQAPRAPNKVSKSPQVFSLSSLKESLADRFLDEGNRLLMLKPDTFLLHKIPNSTKDINESTRNQHNSARRVLALRKKIISA
jgi:hypothetical protein